MGMFGIYKSLCHSLTDCGIKMESWRLIISGVSETCVNMQRLM